MEAFEALQLLKSAYQNAHIGTHLEAEKHATNLSDIFKTNGDVKVGALWKGKGCKNEFDSWLLIFIVSLVHYYIFSNQYVQFRFEPTLNLNRTLLNLNQ